MFGNRVPSTVAVSRNKIWAHETPSPKVQNWEANKHSKPWKLGEGFDQALLYAQEPYVSSMGAFAFLGP